MQGDPVDPVGHAVGGGTAGYGIPADPIHPREAGVFPGEVRVLLIRLCTVRRRDRTDRRHTAGTPREFPGDRVRQIGQFVAARIHCDNRNTRGTGECVDVDGDTRDAATSSFVSATTIR